MNKYEIMQAVAETRKEIAKFAEDWRDVPGGVRNGCAVADWNSLWQRLEELYGELKCAVERERELA